MAERSPEVVRFTDGGLGNDAYLIVSGETAVAVDPARDVRRYLEAAESRKARIVATFETHLHADFVSGARELAARGAGVYASASAGLSFTHRVMREHQRVEVDGLSLRALATPGHSPEHLAYIVEGTDPPILFSGGALIPGGAARTDLLGEERKVELARLLYRTLHERLADLPDATVVHPTHGAGSFCSTGGAGSGDRSTTLGFERKHNPLLNADSEEAFLDTLLSGYGLYPPYFLRLREFNRAGPPVLLGPPGPPRLEPSDVERDFASGAWALDIRSADSYASGHLDQSVIVPLGGGSFAVRLGWVVPWGTRLVLIADDEASVWKATMKAAGIGYEDIAGWATFESLRDAGMRVVETPMVDAQELAALLEGVDRPTVLDVRHPSEWREGILPGAMTVEFGALAQRIPPELRRGPVVTYCATGARAAVAASLLERAGIDSFVIFPGGPEEWRASGRPLAS
ncbi:MAG TPA: rhodanese-like domain-containing protein [Actinomycetota bacterium]|nr:rhodanese-like domain-containing protein [Actinomycetota bacterium]